MPLPTSCTQPPPRPDARLADKARERQQVLTKPPGSLGRLEQLAIELAALQGSESPSVDRVHISVFAGDHGVCDEGISAFPQAVTAQMIANFASGGAAISVMARELGAQLEVVNLGTVGEVPALPGVWHQMIAQTSQNLAKTDALTHEQLQKALNAGDQAAQRAADNRARLFIGGDMGMVTPPARLPWPAPCLTAAPKNWLARARAWMPKASATRPGSYKPRWSVTGKIVNHSAYWPPSAVSKSPGSQVPYWVVPPAGFRFWWTVLLSPSLPWSPPVSNRACGTGCCSATARRNLVINRCWQH